MTTHEALFTDDDRDEQVALDVEEALTHKCGFPLYETTDEAYPYEYDVHENICAACEVHEQFVKEHYGKTGLPAGKILTIRESDERISDRELEVRAQLIADREADQTGDPEDDSE